MREAPGPGLQEGTRPDQRGGGSRGRPWRCTGHGPAGPKVSRHRPKNNRLSGRREESTAVQSELDRRHLRRQRVTSRPRHRLNITQWLGRMVGSPQRCSRSGSGRDIDRGTISIKWTDGTICAVGLHALPPQIGLPSAMPLCMCALSPKMNLATPTSHHPVSGLSPFSQVETVRSAVMMFPACGMAGNPSGATHLINRRGQELSPPVTYGHCPLAFCLNLASSSSLRSISHRLLDIVAFVELGFQAHGQNGGCSQS